MPTEDRYASYMLRFQWMANDQHPTWVVSTQSTKTGELRWFPNLNALIQYLREEFGDAAQQEGAKGLKDAETKGCEGVKTQDK